MHTITDSIVIPRSLSDTWQFFSSPYNLPRITPPSLGFKIVSNPPQAIYPGLLIEYSVSPFPVIPLRWVSEITHVLPLEIFVDEQRFGPYRFWHHQHRFRQVDSGTEVTDEVNYLLPGGPIGALMHRLHVKRQLEFIFGFRRQALTTIFGQPVG